MEKKKVSGFEFAIAQAADDRDFLDAHEPYTSEEEQKMRKERIEKKVKVIFDKMKLNTTTP